MHKNLHFLQICPSEPQFWWQTAVQLYNFRKFGYDKQARVLIFRFQDRVEEEYSIKWEWLNEKFPDTKFFYYPDYGNLVRAILRVDYPPILRPYCFQKHLEQHPELSSDAIFYHDSDVLFTKPLDIEKLVDDDINYLSYTGNRETNYNYQSYQDHILQKERNIKAEMRDEYFKADPWSKLLASFNLTKKFFIDNKHNVGGAQYLLKNMTAKFWLEVFDECCNMRPFLQKVNQKIMKGSTELEREENGFQSWATDMYVIQFLLWKQRKQIVCPVEMDFCWATDPIYRWAETPIYHDAGVGKKIFSKRGKNGEYTKRWGVAKTPFEDDLSWVSPQFCSYNYINELREAQKYLKL